MKRCERGKKNLLLNYMELKRKAFNYYSVGRKLCWRKYLTQLLRLSYMRRKVNYSSGGSFELLGLVFKVFVRDACCT
jgi:hypothetical protein